MNHPFELIAEHIRSGFVHVACKHMVAAHTCEICNPLPSPVRREDPPKNLVPLGTPDLEDHESLTRLVERLEQIKEAGVSSRRNAQYVQDAEDALVALKKLRSYW